MKEFAIRLTSVQDVQEFVSLATAQAFPISVRDSHLQVNGKSFMEMFCLNFGHPLTAVVECDEVEFRLLMEQMGRFLA